MEKLSTCCGAEPVEWTSDDLCSDCLEHAEFMCDECMDDDGGEPCECEEE